MNELIVIANKIGHKQEHRPKNLTVPLFLVSINCFFKLIPETTILYIGEVGENAKEKVSPH